MVEALGRTKAGRTGADDENVDITAYRKVSNTVRGIARLERFHGNLHIRHFEIVKGPGAGAGQETQQMSQVVKKQRECGLRRLKNPRGVTGF